ncbi:hypothetical protein ABIF69_004528 [Bradyrhizobium japonicum]
MVRGRLEYSRHSYSDAGVTIPTADFSIASYVRQAPQFGRWFFARNKAPYNLTVSMQDTLCRRHDDRRRGHRNHSTRFAARDRRSRDLRAGYECKRRRAAIDIKQLLVLPLTHSEICKTTIGAAWRRSSLRRASLQSNPAASKRTGLLPASQWLALGQPFAELSRMSKQLTAKNGGVTLPRMFWLLRH